MLLQFCPYKNVYIVTFFAENYDHAFIAQRELIGEPFLRFGLKITRSIMKGKGDSHSTIIRVWLHIIAAIANYGIPTGTCNALK